VLFRTPEAAQLRKRLHDRGIAIRRCDTFVGLDEQYLRAAVRREWPLLAQAISDLGRQR
jgi:histidinol-phosphate aminotransferase